MKQIDAVLRPTGVVDLMWFVAPGGQAVQPHEAHLLAFAIYGVAYMYLDLLAMRSLVTVKTGRIRVSVLLTVRRYTSEFWQV